MALASCPAWCGRERSLRNIFQPLSWALAPGSRGSDLPQESLQNSAILSTYTVRVMALLTQGKSLSGPGESSGRVEKALPVDCYMPRRRFEGWFITVTAMWRGGGPISAPRGLFLSSTFPGAAAAPRQM